MKRGDETARDEHLEKYSLKGVLPFGLDANEVARAFTVSTDGKLQLDGLISEEYDSIEFTYVTSGNGTGEIETTVYKEGAVIVATLTFAYDVNDKVTSITKT